MPAEFSHRIQDLVGFDYDSNTINSEDEALEVAAAEVIDLLPTEVLLKNAVSPTDVVSGSTTMNIDGKKILRVIRFDTLNTVGRVCSKVDIDEWKGITADSNSIYHPTDHSPVYTENGTTLEIFPDITGSANNADSAKVWYITYPIGASTESLSAIPGLPNEADHAVALKASMYILDTMISDKVQDDEDEEMLRMLQAQKQNLEQTYQLEMQRLAGDSQGEKA